MRKYLPKYRLLTFLSPTHRCHQLLNRITTSTIVIAFDDCIGIIIEQQLIIDLRLSLVFIDGASQCHEFDGHLIFEQSDRFTQVIQYE